MRRISTLLTAILFFYASNSQEITIAAANDLYVSPVTSFTLNGSTLTGTNTAMRGTASNTYSMVDRELNGIILAPVPPVVSAQWGAITAYRRSREVVIEWTTEQEIGVDNFSVERSTDARVWYTVAENIPAANRLQRTQYTQTDGIYHPEQLYYRIKQTCGDSITYSSYAIVPEENSPVQLSIYPNPVSRYFSIAGIDPLTIKQVELYDAGGIMVKAWVSAQARYQLPALRPGTYYLRVYTADGTALDKTIIIQ